MAWLKIDTDHQEVLDLLVSSSRVASPSGRALTGPFSEQRQVVTYAAAVGYAAGRTQAVGQSKVQIRDTIMLGAPGAAELAFVLAYQSSGWDLSVIADGDDASDARLKALEQYAAGGFAVVDERYSSAGRSVSAAELMLLVQSNVEPPKASYQPEREEQIENPLIAALRRRGKLQPPAGESA